jgi:hypothetical protein
MKKPVIILAAIAAATLTSAAAQSETSYSGVERISLVDFTGRLEIKVGGKGAKLRIDNDDGKLSVTEKEGVLTLAGPERPRRYNVSKEIGWAGDHDKAFARFLDDYPTVVITAAPGTDLLLDDAIAMISAGDIGGELMIEHSYLEGNIGDVAVADIGVYGPGDLTIGAVRGNFSAGLGGSGSIAAISAANADLKIGGSGDIEIGAVDGDLSAKIGGSGDIRTDNVGGRIEATISGSGNIGAKKVAKGGEFRISGSGDIVLASVNGQVSASIAGSGDIDIGGGRAEDLDVSIHGSGDFHFKGVSTNLRATVNGSGSVVVAENEGSLYTSGRGHFRVGDVVIDKDD